MKYLLATLALLFFVNVEAQKSRTAIAGRILYDSPNEKETFMKLATNKATPLNILFAQATPNMGDIETSFMASIRQTAASMQLPTPPTSGKSKDVLQSVTSLNTYLKGIHDEYFLRYNPFASFPETAYNKTFSAITASIVYSLIFTESRIWNNVFVNEKNNGVLLSFRWGSSLCVFDPSYTQSDPLRIISEQDKKDYFDRLVKAKIILEEDLSSNADSLYLLSNYNAKFFSHKKLAAGIYLNELMKQEGAPTGLHLLYNLLKVDLIDNQLLKSGLIEEYISQELKSFKYRLDDEFRYLFFLAVYSTSPENFDALFNMTISRRSDNADLPKLLGSFANDVLALDIPESSRITIRRYSLANALSSDTCSLIKDSKASMVLNELNELMYKDSVINRTTAYKFLYSSTADDYIEKIMKRKGVKERITFYNTLYDNVARKEMVTNYAPVILNKLGDEISNKLSNGNVTQALAFYSTIKQLKGDPIKNFNNYHLNLTLEALYNATRDKGMANAARDIRKTINSMKEIKEVEVIKF